MPNRLEIVLTFYFLLTFVCLIGINMHIDRVCH